MWSNSRKSATLRAKVSKEDTTCNMFRSKISKEDKTVDNVRGEIIGRGCGLR